MYIYTAKYLLLIVPARISRHFFEVGTRRIYVVTCLWLPETNNFRVQSDNVAILVHNARSRTSGADIDTNIMIMVGVQGLAVR